MSESRYRKDIEGLRGIAVLLVVLFHVKAPGFEGGFTGVDVFFVLSGYLISQIIVREVESDSFSLLTFYARRARRLLPASTLVLVSTIGAAYVILAPYEQVGLSWSAMSAAAYVSNMRFAQQATDYLAGAADSDPFLHTWSLSVEEQFYLFWPLLLSVVLGGNEWFRDKSRRRLLTVLAVASVLSFLLNLLLTRAIQPWAFFGMPTRVWEFGLGALAALLPRFAFERSLRTDLIHGGAVLGVVISAMWLDTASPFPGWRAMAPALCTAIALRTGEDHVDTPLMAGISSPLFQWMGKLSYSWYLWHWPLLVLGQAVTGRHDDLGVRLVLGTAALGLAALSYFTVEAPVRGARALATRPGLSVRGGLTLSILTVIAGLIWKAGATAAGDQPDQRELTEAKTDRTGLYATPCIVRLFGTVPVRCTYGDSAATSSIVLMGDSHAAHWFPAMDSVARLKGLALRPQIKTECPFPTLSAYSHPGLRRTYTECAEWRSAVLDSIVAEQPRLVVAASSYGYTGYGITSSEWERSLISSVRRLKAAGIPVVILRDVPRPGFDVPSCLARAAWRGNATGHPCNFRSSDSLAEQFAKTERRVALAENIPFVDLNGEICPSTVCETRTATMVKYYDSNHLTATYARSLVPVLQRVLVPYMAPARPPLSLR